MNPYESQQKNQNIDPRPPVLKQPKSQLFFSKYCKFCNTLINKIQKTGQESSFDFICIDNRFIKENITYVNMFNNNQAMPLPPMINRVPTLLLVPNYEVLVGDQILEYISPKTKTIQQEQNAINMEPNPFSITNDSTGGFGVASDTYSFLDMSTDELSAAGNGGERQMYDYSSVNGPVSEIQTPMKPETLNTPVQNDRENKMRMSMEEIQNRRKNELSY